MRHTKRKAFTLVELLVVVAVIGILFVVLLAKVDFATNKAKATGVQTDFRAYQLAFEAVAKENSGFNTLGWDVGDTNGDRIRNSYDTGDLNHNGHCDKAGENGAVEDEIFTGRKVYAEKWTGIFTLKNPADPDDSSALLALETAINQHLMESLHISISEDGTVSMAKDASDPWGGRYYGSYTTSANIDKLDRGAIILYSSGPDLIPGSGHSLLGGEVQICVPGANIHGMDDFTLSTVWSLKNGYGEVLSATTGFQNNLGDGPPVSFDHNTIVVEDLGEPDFFVTTQQELTDAIAQGGLIRLGNDITVDHGDSRASVFIIPAGKVITLDLNGKTLSSGENFAGQAFFENKAGAKLTITGNGTIEMTPRSGAASVIFVPRGGLIIRNGTFKIPYHRGNDKRPEGNGSQAKLFAGIRVGASGNPAAVEIYGGYFDSGYWRTDEFVSYNTSGVASIDTLMNLSVNQSFLVYGGSFVGYNPAWGDEACSAYYTSHDEKVATTRPSPKQGLFLFGQDFDDTELPAGYTIYEGITLDGTARPLYTVVYSEPEPAPDPDPDP